MKLTAISLTGLGVFLLAAAASASPPTYQFHFGSFGSGDEQFTNLHNIALDESSNVYVADLELDRVQKFDSLGNFVTKWGTTGTGQGQFDHILGLAVNDKGGVFVAEFNNNRVQVFDRNGTYSTEWPVQEPIGVAVHPVSGDVYVASDLDSVFVFSSIGVAQFSFGGVGSGPGQFVNLNGVAIDFRGAVYVSDGSANHRVTKFTSEGTYLSEIGGPGTGDGEFDSPSGMTTDSNGNLYVGDFWNHRFQMFDSTGTFLMRWGKFGNGAGQLERPLDIAISNSGILFTVEDGNPRVQAFSVNNCAPVVEVLTPTPGQVYSPGDNMPIQWDAGDDGGVNTVDIEFIPGPKLYAIASGVGTINEGFLYEISPIDGDADLVGDTGYERTGTLATHPKTCVMYATAERTGNGLDVLLTIDPATGVATEVGGLDELAKFGDLAFHPKTGALYAHRRKQFAEPSSKFFKIDTLLGCASEISTTGLEGRGGGMTFDLGNRFFLASTSLAHDMSIYRMDPETGSSDYSIGLSTSPPLTNQPRVKAMATHPVTGQIYAIYVDNSNQEQLGIVQPINGLIANIGTTIINADGLTFGPGDPISIAKGEPNDGRYSWTVPDTPTNGGWIRITAHDKGGKKGSDCPDGPFGILNTTTAPTPTVNSALSLAPTYPNPTTGATTIRYSLPLAGHVQLTVHDALGRLVRELINGNSPSGESVIVWDGLNHAGVRVASGHYLLRLDTHGEVRTRGISLIR